MFIRYDREGVFEIFNILVNCKRNELCVKCFVYKFINRVIYFCLLYMEVKNDFFMEKEYGFFVIIINFCNFLLRYFFIFNNIFIYLYVCVIMYRWYNIKKIIFERGKVEILRERCRRKEYTCYESVCRIIEIYKR